MKKLLFALAAVPLLAAGCNSSTTGSVSVQTPPTPPAQTEPTTPPPVTPPSDTTPPPPAQVQSNVQVNTPDDAVNVLEQGSADEQTKASGGDESDVTASDTTELNGYSNVTTGY